MLRTKLPENKGQWRIDLYDEKWFLDKEECSYGGEKIKKCQIMIINKWMNTKEDTLIEGAPALTTASILICAYGGVIRFITDGQD